jgi:phospholipid-translocating ATPase
MLFTILFFNDSFVNIVTITFTALIFIEILNVFSEVTKVKFKMVMSVIGTIIVYLASIIFLRQYFDTSYINMMFFYKVIALTLVCWLPLHMAKKCIQKIDPSEEDKVNSS